LKCLQPKLFWVRNPPKMSSTQSQTRQQEIDEYDTDKMPTIADIDEIYVLSQLDDRMRLTLDRVSNWIARRQEEIKGDTYLDLRIKGDTYFCIGCDYTLSRGDFERGKGRIMFTDVTPDDDMLALCGVCDDRVDDPQGLFPNTDSEDYDSDDSNLRFRGKSSYTNLIEPKNFCKVPMAE
jgi:hypothetical protein